MAEMIIATHPRPPGPPFARAGAGSPLAPRPFRGVSLIEMVIALSILAGGLVVAMRVFPVGLRLSQRSEMSSRATILAQKSIEGLKLKSWDELTEGETVAHEEDFDLITRIDTADVEGIEDSERLKTILINVRWEERGRSRQLAFVTYVRRPVQ